MTRPRKADDVGNGLAVDWPREWGTARCDSSAGVIETPKMVILAVVGVDEHVGWRRTRPVDRRDPSNPLLLRNPGQGRCREQRVGVLRAGIKAQEYLAAARFARHSDELLCGKAGGQEQERGP